MSSRLARSAGLISIATMASRVLGVARESVLARYFGASADPSMDAFNVAFRVPNLVRDLFAEGAMTAAFVPTFTRTLNSQGREAAWRLGNLVINALLVVTGVLVVLGIVFAPQITRFIASGEVVDLALGLLGLRVPPNAGFLAVPGKLELTTQLTQIMMPFLTTIAVAVAMMGMLNSLHRFFLPALSPAMFNVATIVVRIALVPVMPGIGPAARSPASRSRTLLGGVGQIAVQWPALRREGFRYRPILDFRDPGVREILRLMGPGTLGLAAVQINVLVNTSLASTQEQGAVSWLQYAFRLMYLPIGLFGVSIATAALPRSLSRRAADGQVGDARDDLVRPAHDADAERAGDGRADRAGASDRRAAARARACSRQHDTAATAAALIFYAPGLLGYSAVKIASPSFYALDDSRTPVIVSVGERRVQSGAQPRARPHPGLSRARARDGHRGDVQRRRAARAPRPPHRWPRRDGASGSRSSRSPPRRSLMGAAAYFTSEWLRDRAAGRPVVRAARSASSRAIAPAVLVLLAAARAARHRRAQGRDGPRLPAARPALTCAFPPPPDDPADGQRPRDGGRLRQHLRAAAAAPHPEARPLARRRRHADDALSDGGVGGADWLRTARGSLASPRARHGRPGRLGQRSQPHRAGHDAR